MTDSTVSVNEALQVLRPPEPGLPYLRLDRADEMSTEPGSVALEGKRIADFEARPDAPVQIDARGCAVIPGFVDCHTHLPFAGWRAGEYALKVAGASYEEISRSGGGIRASARALRESADEEVLAQATALAAEMLAHGTTTFECKSGYGLTADAELRLLALAQALGARVAQQTTSTALLAHAVPEQGTAADWMAEVARIVPEAVRRFPVSALDIYVESVAFTNDDLATMGELARANALDLRAHVEQFAHHGSVPVALSAGARSVDHVNWLADDEIQPLAESECAAVLLPGAEFMGVERHPPAAELAEAGAVGALATDANPGTSPIVSLPLVIGLAVRRYGWSVPTALVAATHNAAWVLRMSGTVGSLETGKRADLVVLDGPLEHVPYRFGHNPVACVIVAGEVRYLRPDFAGRVTRSAASVA